MAGSKTVKMLVFGAGQAHNESGVTRAHPPIFLKYRPAFKKKGPLIAAPLKPQG